MIENPTGADERHARSRTARFLALPFRRRRTRPVPPDEAQVETGTRGVGEHLILGVAVGVLLGVAGAAGYVSYHHFYRLSLRLGEHQDMAILYPAMSDGVIVMASLVMVYCSRRGLPVPLLAKAALALGGVVTLVANVANGWDGGTGSRLLSALAPVAFVAAYELLMWLVRSRRQATATVAETVTDDHVCQPVEVPVEVERVVTALPLDRYEAARLTFEESLQPGSKRIGRRALANRWGLEQREAEEVIADVERERAESVEPDVSEEPVAKPGVRWGDRVVPVVNGSPATGTAVAAAGSVNGHGPGGGA